MDGSVVDVPARRIAGIAIRTRNADEMDPAKARIGALWQRFTEEKIAEQLGGGGPVFAVYSAYESDQHGAYSLCVGVETDRPASGIAGGATVEVPAGKYRVFEGRGPLPGAVFEAWQRIWKAYADGPRRRAFSVDFEEYGPFGVRVFVAER